MHLRLPVVHLKKNLREAILQGHPWIFREALRGEGLSRIPNGFVEIRDAHGFVGYGIYDPYRPIAVRVLSLKREEPPAEELIRTRILTAKALRDQLLPPGVEAYRLIHGEADGLPGVALDLYKNVAVLRSDGAGMEPMVKLLVQVLERLKGELGIEALVHRRSRSEAAGTPGKLLFGRLPSLPFLVQEYAWRLEVDPLEGQKTGLFLDQRENRKRIYELGISGAVLNLFAYSGGFGVAAALGGARRVVEVDVSEKAREASLRNFSWNGIPPEKHEFFLADLFRGFPERVRRERYTLIILDPPSLAPNERSVPRARRAYRYLLKESLELLEPGGILAASSCSSHISEGSFLELIAEAALKVQRHLRIVEIRSAGVDHPVLPGFPESRYLKFVLLRSD